MNKRRVKFADLHLHTRASDGLLSPEALVERCANLGISVIALTDHDTIAGIEPAREAAVRYRIGIVPAVELGTQFEEQEIHLLGYFIDHKSKRLASFLKGVRNQRLIRAERILHKLSERGLHVGFDTVKQKAGNGTIGRPHIAKAMVEEGVVASYIEAFDCWIGDGKPAAVAKSKINPGEMIDMIHEAGGVVILAHPGAYFEAAKLNKLLQAGLDGIEVIHPRHSKETQIKLANLALQKGLLVTGGSDFHGGARHEELLGKYGLESHELEKIRGQVKKLRM